MNGVPPNRLCICKMPGTGETDETIESGLEVSTNLVCMLFLTTTPR